MAKNHHSIGGYDGCTQSSGFGNGASSSSASGDRSTTANRIVFVKKHQSTGGDNGCEEQRWLEKC